MTGGRVMMAQVVSLRVEGDPGHAGLPKLGDRGTVSRSELCMSCNLDLWYIRVSALQG